MSLRYGFISGRGGSRATQIDDRATATRALRAADADDAPSWRRDASSLDMHTDTDLTTITNRDAARASSALVGLRRARLRAGATRWTRFGVWAIRNYREFLTRGRE